MATGDARRPTVDALAAIVAAAFNLRIAVVAVGTLLDQIRADTRMGAILAGALGAIPFLCMGLFAQVGVPLVLRFGVRRLIAASLTLIVAATLARAAMPTAALIVMATIPVGIGIALIGLAPAVIKRSFATRMGAATGAYVAAQSIRAAATALTMVPLAGALHGWRPAFAFSVLPTVLALPLWLLLQRRDRFEAISVAARSMPHGGRRAASRRGGDGCSPRCSACSRCATRR